MKNYNLGLVAVGSILLSLGASAMDRDHYNTDNVFNVDRVLQYADEANADEAIYDILLLDKPVRYMDMERSFYNNDMIKYYDKKTGLYVVLVNTDGFKKTELSVNVERRILNISGVSRSSTANTSRSGRFSFSISLPSDADEDSVTSEYKNGMLYVKIQKKNKVNFETRKIDIQ